MRLEPPPAAITVVKVPLPSDHQEFAVLFSDLVEQVIQEVSGFSIASKLCFFTPFFRLKKLGSLISEY